MGVQYSEEERAGHNKSELEAKRAFQILLIKHVYVPRGEAKNEG